MSFDIGKILGEWPYEPDKISARLIEGEDGREKIQLRLDLGLLQMETTGRPDGDQPHECESLLAHHQRRLQKHRERYGSDEGFELEESDCEELRNEAVMYYHRYLAEFVLERFEAVVRDTKRNLRLMDFLAAHAKEESDRQAMERYRPYVIMMHTRARALGAFREDRPRAALAAVKRGIDRIKEFYGRSDDDMETAHAGELSILGAMEKELSAQLPVDPVERLRKELSRAVREERYEDAAALRDQLREMVDEDSPPEG